MAGTSAVMRLEVSYCHERQKAKKHIQWQSGVGELSYTSGGASVQVWACSEADLTVANKAKRMGCFSLDATQLSALHNSGELYDDLSGDSYMFQITGLLSSEISPAAAQPLLVAPAALARLPAPAPPPPRTQQQLPEGSAPPRRKVGFRPSSSSPFVPPARIAPVPAALPVPVLGPLHAHRPPASTAQRQVYAEVLATSAARGAQASSEGWSGHGWEGVDEEEEEGGGAGGGRPSRQEAPAPVVVRSASSQSGVVRSAVPLPWTKQPPPMTQAGPSAAAPPPPSASHVPSLPAHLPWQAHTRARVPSPLLLSLPPPELVCADHPFSRAYVCMTCTRAVGTGRGGGVGLPCPSCYWQRHPFPDGPYSSLPSYSDTLSTAVLQEVLWRVGEVAARYWRAYVACKGGWEGLQRACRAAGVPYYASVDLIRTVKEDADSVARKAWAKRMAAKEKAGSSRGGAGQRKRQKVEEEGQGEEEAEEATAGQARPRVPCATLAQVLAVLESGTSAVTLPSPSPSSPCYALPHGPRLFLRVQQGDVERIGGTWAKDDLWIVSTRPTFGHDPAPPAPIAPAPACPAPAHSKSSSSSYGQQADAIRRAKTVAHREQFFTPVSPSQPFTFLARAAYHGLTAKGMLLLQPLSFMHGCGVLGPYGGVSPQPGTPPLPAGIAPAVAWPKAVLEGPRCMRVCALRVPDASMSMEGQALALLATVRALPPPGVERVAPLLPALTQGPTGRGAAVPALPLPLSRAQLEAVVTSYTASFVLNPGQASVLQGMAAWFRTDGEEEGKRVRPLLLVHGVFGSGKSHTLVAALAMLCELLDVAEGRPAAPQGQGQGEGEAEGEGEDASEDDLGLDMSEGEASDEEGDAEEDDEDAEDEESFCSPEPDPLPTYTVLGVGKGRRTGGTVGAGIVSASGGPRTRILVAGGTNVAVDRILSGLIAHYTRTGRPCPVARVGAGKRVAPQVLPYLLPASLSPQACESAAKELESLLSQHGGGPPGLEPALIQSTVAKLRKTQACAAQLAQARVVGATCASVSFPVLQGCTFPIVLLDESSQVPESTSLLPATLYASSLCAAVGDPCQLPPVMAGPPVKVERRQTREASLESSTLFERCARLGWAVTRLSTQYRCHSVLADLASRLFYGGQGVITTGAREESTAAVLPGMPPLCVFDYSGACACAVGPPVPWDAARMSERGEGEGQGGGSVYNDYETSVLVSLVREAVHQHALSPASIGIICLYRAAAGRVRAALDCHPALQAGVGAGVQVSTVDAFQGMEKEVIFVCTSRSRGGTAGSGGHLEDARRLCVTLTRAKRHCLILTHARSIQGYPLWQEVIVEASRHVGGVRTTGCAPLLGVAQHHDGQAMRPHPQAQCTTQAGPAHHPQPLQPVPNMPNVPAGGGAPGHVSKAAMPVLEEDADDLL